MRDGSKILRESWKLVKSKLIISLILISQVWMNLMLVNHFYSQFSEDNPQADQGLDVPADVAPSAEIEPDHIQSPSLLSYFLFPSNIFYHIYKHFINMETVCQVLTIFFHQLIIYSVIKSSFGSIAEEVQLIIYKKRFAN